MTSAELSSLASLLDDLLGRVSAIVETETGTEEADDAVTGLFEVERSLQEARRRMARVLELAG